MRLYKDIDLTACRWQALFRGWFPLCPVVHSSRTSCTCFGPCYAFLPAWIFFVYVYVFTRRRNRDSMSRQRLGVPEQHRIKELQNRRPGGWWPEWTALEFLVSRFRSRKVSLRREQLETDQNIDRLWFVVAFRLLYFVCFNIKSFVNFENCDKYNVAINNCNKFEIFWEVYSFVSIRTVCSLYLLKKSNKVYTITYICRRVSM